MKNEATILRVCNEEPEAGGAISPEDVVISDQAGNVVAGPGAAAIPGMVPSNQVNAANASTALATVTDQRLTSFATGYPRDALTELADFLAPRVPAPIKFDYTVMSKTSGYGALQDDYVGQNGLPAVIQFDPKTTANGTLVFRGAEVGMHETEIQAANAMPGGSADEEFQDRVGMLIDALRRGRIQRVIAAAAAAAGGATAKTWDSSADPISDLYGYIDAIAPFVGGRQNVRLCFGATAWNIMRFQAKIVGGANYPYQIVTRDKIAGLLDLPPENLHVSYLQATSSKQGKTGTYVALMTAAEVYVFGCTQNPTRRDPSFLKTFVMSQSGADMPVYTYMPHPLITRKGVAYWELVAATNASAVTRLTISSS